MNWMLKTIVLFCSLALECQCAEPFKYSNTEPRNLRPLMKEIAIRLCKKYHTKHFPVVFDDYGYPIRTFPYFPSRVGCIELKLSDENNLYGVEDSRRLVVAALEDMIEYLNADEYGRPLWANYPINEEDVLVEFYFNKEELPPDTVLFLYNVVANHGKIEYNYRHADRFIDIKTITETYQEALEKLRSTSNEKGLVPQPPYLPNFNCLDSSM